MAHVFSGVVAGPLFLHASPSQSLFVVLSQGAEFGKFSHVPGRMNGFLSFVASLYWSGGAQVRLFVLFLWFERLERHAPLVE